MIFVECLSADPPGMDFKTAIKILKEKIDLADIDIKGRVTQELALLYLKDQDQEQAFKVFLEALNFIKVKIPNKACCPEEYNKAFSIYINQSSISPQETSVHLIETLTPIVEKNPDQHLLNYFIAIAYANLGKYEEFFKHFFNAFQYNPDHYLADKTKSILHIKLLERTRENSEREAQRTEIMHHLLLALEKEPKDATIYKLLITFSPKEKKRELVQLCLKKILNVNIMIPRSELMFYVLEAIDVDEIKWCQHFISRSKEWYPQSRLVATAEEYFNSRIAHR